MIGQTHLECYWNVQRQIDEDSSVTDSTSEGGFGDCANIHCGKRQRNTDRFQSVSGLTHAQAHTFTFTPTEFRVHHDELTVFGLLYILCSI